ncbi:hypothetical protein C8Q77DRAFT_1108711 [Trametes polyzona]|nr:hypothetical protein C8Q77DRAFT_1108711 [Trametes polyzona]
MFLSRGWSRADLAEAVTRASVEVELSSSATSLHDTIGVLLVGNFIGLFLYGLTLYQAYRYACVFPNDAMWLKAITISSGLGVHTCIYYLVTNYGHPEVLEHRVCQWSPILHSNTHRETHKLYPLLSGLTMVVSQSFFIRRLWFFEPRYRPIVSVAGVCSLAQLAATTEMFAANGTTDIRTLSRLWPIGFTLALGSDVLLTALLVYTLHRSRTGMKRTDKMIDVLIVYTAKTVVAKLPCCLPRIVDLLTVISAFVRPNSYIYVALGLCGARVYAITLLSA